VKILNEKNMITLETEKSIRTTRTHYCALNYSRGRPKYPLSILRQMTVKKPQTFDRPVYTVIILCLLLFTDSIISQKLNRYAEEYIKSTLLIFTT
jgi:hypothetical protein